MTVITDPAVAGWLQVALSLVAIWLNWRMLKIAQKSSGLGETVGRTPKDVLWSRWAVAVAVAAVVSALSGIYAVSALALLFSCLLMNFAFLSRDGSASRMEIVVLAWSVAMAVTSGLMYLLFRLADSLEDVVDVLQELTR